MIEEYVPSDHQNDNFYERFMEQRSRDLNEPGTTEEHVSFPFPGNINPPIHFLISKHKLLHGRPGNILAQFNNLFVTVPPAWLEAALNLALKSPNTIAHSPNTPILSQYWEQSPGRVINFDPPYPIATFL